MKLENGYYYQLIAPGTRTTVTFTNSGDSLPYGAVLTLTGDGIEVAPSSVTVNGSKSYSFVISAASEGVHKAKLVAKTAAGYEYYSRELLFICARDRYDFDIPVICSDMVGESIQKVDFLQADNPSTKLAINPDLMPSGYRAAWNISHTTGDGSATIKLTDSSAQRTPPVLYTKSGVGKAEATITLTVILPAGEVLEREIPVEYEVRAQVPMSFKTTGDVVVAKLGETAAVDLTTGEAGSALTDGMSVSAAFKSNYDATLTTTTFSADKGFSIGATRSGVYQVTVTAVSDVPGLADGAKFSKDVCLIVADENGNLPFGLFKITPDKLSTTLYSDASTLGTVSVIPTFDIPDGTAFLTEWSVKDSKGNTANITADTTGHARGDVAALKTAGSVTAGEYTVTATINLAGAVTTVSMPLTLTAGQPVIDGLRESYTVPYSYSEYVISAPGVMLEKSSGKWAEYNGSVKWKCEALSLAMAAEETSTHPLASAILRYGREIGAQMPLHGEIITEVSRGSRTDVGGKIVRVGNLKYMNENGVKTDRELPDPEGAIPNYVGVDDKIVAVLFAMDSPRQNVRRAINSLRYDGVGDIELLTGDMEAQARAVAAQVGADGYRAQLLPEQKAEAVLKLQTQGNGVVMVGDGINDAPALAYADVGISLGSKSTDIAMETSDVIINRDDPMVIPELRRLARATMRIVQQNFAMVIGINTVGLILGAASGISVMMSALMHNASTILVVANSLRLMFFTPGERR